MIYLAAYGAACGAAVIVWACVALADRLTPPAPLPRYTPPDDPARDPIPCGGPDDLEEYLAA